MNYAEDIKLNYGEHVIRVSLTGYEDFAGILSIGESTSTVQISLAEETEEEEFSDFADSDEDEDSSDSSSGNVNEEEDYFEEEDFEDSNTRLEEDESTEGTQAMGTTEIDSEHQITIQGPEGAEVYLNGILKGTAPLSFDKEIGTHTIILSQTGYTTKSYTVEVRNDGEDITFNFPAMKAEE